MLKTGFHGNLQITYAYLDRVCTPGSPKVHWKDVNQWVDSLTNDTTPSQTQGEDSRSQVFSVQAASLRWFRTAASDVCEILQGRYEAWKTVVQTRKSNLGNHALIGGVVANHFIALSLRLGLGYDLKTHVFTATRSKWIPVSSLFNSAYCTFGLLLPDFRKVGNNSRLVSIGD